MTHEEKAANVVLLAERVMGYTEVGTMDDLGLANYRLVNGQVMPGNRIGFWDPYTNIGDAMEMLRRFGEIRLEKIQPFGTWICYIFDGKGARAPGHTTELEAICAACLEWALAQGEK